ncbi:50S ribosomal protein L9 [Buchnera aphidicola]|uniref:Large ribosomal subunit protein bL9 n=1 Tax=Buchnera aphidicola (Cinara strobi) TaxID=1921549 RepID=A0A3B1E829_9GAMM|nr:50S ribosomal protein L9 [Buchnera aphidicola]VAX76877.1 50S ribosomal protein L9 [Buchnera aphidicola (Cinara strobi)]
MKVILLNTIGKIGRKGKLIKVKNGYARNYLIPTKQALLATKENIELFEKNKIFKEKEESKKINHSIQRINIIKSIGAIVFFMKSSEKKKIFGSIGIKDIISNFYHMGILIHKHEIHLPKGLLRYLGLHQAIFTPYKNMSTTFTISILSK